MNTASFVIERTMNAPVDRVWKALTHKEEMKQWYFDLAKFNPVTGFEFRFYGEGLKGEQYLHLCRILEVETEKKLSYSWCYEGYNGYSVVSFELFAEGHQTRLKLTHDGLDSFPKDHPDFAKENFVAGWTQLIGTLLPQFLNTNK